MTINYAELIKGLKASGEPPSDNAGDQHHEAH